MKKLSFATFCFIAGLLPFALSAAETVDRAHRSLVSLSPENPYFPFILLAGIIVAVATFFFPRLGLIIMLLSMLVATDMPIGKGAESARAVTLRFEDLILVLVSMGWIFHRARTRTLSIIRYVPVNGPVLIMAGVILIATLTGYFQETVSARRGFFFAMKRLEYFWMFFMTLNIMESEKEVRLSLKVLFAASVFIALTGVVQFFLFPLSELVGGGTTATVGFGRANTLGDFLLLMIGLTMAFSIYADTPRKTLVFTLLFILFMITLILSKSRGAYVSVPPILLLVAYLSRNWKITVTVAACGLFLFLYFFIMSFLGGGLSELLALHHEDISEQFQQIGAVAEEGVDVDPSLKARVNSWKGSVNQIISYPVFGQGCGAKKLGYADNQYVRELLETGLIGLAAFLFMNAAIFLFNYNLFRYSENKLLRILSLGFIGGHAGMMVHGVTMSNFYTIFNMEVFWFVLALIMILYHNEKKLRMESLQGDLLDDQ